VPISLSGNTDCYQPAEKRFRLTKALLDVCNEFNQPVGIITKNAGVLRDLDLLQAMAEKRMVSVIITITSLNEALRSVMEPRTTTAAQRLRTIEKLSSAGVQTGVMLGPMIPGLNEHEMPAIIKAASEAGATFSAYTFIRLNGAVKFLFHDWLYKNFPDKADKVWHLIEEGHGGKVADSEFGRRMRGEGNMAKLIADQYKTYTQKYGLKHERLELDCTKFRRPGEQGRLF
jgi:DNA repair photolyase